MCIYSSEKNFFIIVCSMSNQNMKLDIVLCCGIFKIAKQCVLRDNTSIERHAWI